MNKNKLLKNSFTMMEFIFVIVIIGILAAIAIPKLNATRTDAKIFSTLEKIENSIKEITSFIIANGGQPNDYNLTDMSQTLKQLYQMGKARPANSNDPIDHMWIYTDKDKPVGHGCVDIATGDDNVRIEFEEKAKGPVCLGIKRILGYDKLPENKNGDKLIYYKIHKSKVNF